MKWNAVCVVFFVFSFLVVKQKKKKKRRGGSFGGMRCEEEVDEVDDVLMSRLNVIDISSTLLVTFGSEWNGMGWNWNDNGENRAGE